LAVELRFFSACLAISLTSVFLYASDILNVCVVG
jgi:hypothetical protein